MKPICLFILGPTGVGKSSLALDSANRYGGEIINCDSVQIYQHLDIGSAKPSQSEFSQIPHHLFDIVSEGQSYTAGDFRQEALRLIESRFSDGVNHFFVPGGSGFYAQALETGLYPTGPTSPGVRAQVQGQLEELGLEGLHEELKRRDPLTAQKVKPNDSYRIVRALEVYWETGKSMSQVRQEFAAKKIENPFLIKKVGLKLSREELRLRVGLRTQKMLAAGWTEEVIAFRRRGFGEWAPLRSVGYQEIQEHLDGRLSEDLLVDAIVQSTMRLAKKQMTWFRRDPSIKWFEVEHGHGPALDYLGTLVES